MVKIDRVNLYTMLSTINSHPRDSHIKFYDFYGNEEHVYILDWTDKRPISTTTLVHKYFSDFDADGTLNMYYNNWQRNPTHYAFGLSRQQVKDKWEKDRVEASTLGTKMHNQIEWFFNNQLKEMPTTVEFGYFLDWWNDFQINSPKLRAGREDHPGFQLDFTRFKPYRTEWEVYDEDKMVSGSIDMVMSNPEGELIIIDWKRSKEIKTKAFKNKMGTGALSSMPDCNYGHYTMQLNVYRYLLETRYQKTVIGLYLCIMHPNADAYRFEPVMDVQYLVEAIMDEL